MMYEAWLCFRHKGEWERVCVGVYPEHVAKYVLMNINQYYHGDLAFWNEDSHQVFIKDTRWIGHAAGFIWPVNRPKR